MIDRVHIRGFQSLADVELPLGRFTVIQGRSNSGKSAVIRALRAIVTNGGNLRGTGGSFIHHGSKVCIVEIERADGKLVWSKSSTKTLYELNGKPYQTGTDVPEAVADFLKLGDIPLDADNKLNVNFQGGGRNQGQFEPPFMVVDRPGSFIAKVFALLTSANVLYEAQAVAKKESRAKGGRLKTLRELATEERGRLETAQEEHRVLHEASERAKLLHEHVTALTAERQRLAALGQGLDQATQQLAQVEADLAAARAVDLSAFEAAEAEATQLRTLQAYADGLAKLDAEIAQVNAVATQALPTGIDTMVEEAQGLVARLISLQQYATTTAGADNELAQIAAAQGQARADAAAAEAELTALVHELGSCPLCHQSLVPEMVLA